MGVRHRAGDESSDKPPLEVDEASILEGVRAAQKDEDMRVAGGSSGSCAAVSLVLGVLLIGASLALMLGAGPPTAPPAAKPPKAGSQLAAASAKVAEAARPQPLRDVAAMTREVERLDQHVRKVKRSLAPGTYMETDPVGLNASRELQRATRELLREKYGQGPYRADVLLEFPDTMPGDKTAHLLLELAPIELMPHAVHIFLKAVVEDFRGAAFHRRAPHVLQALVEGGKQGLAFQEYSSEFPHKQGTLGYAGRPGGPGFYISIVDNTRNHGPGSQNARNPHEADSCFAKVIEGFDDVVQRMKTQPGGDGGAGFINDSKNFINIKSVTIMKDAMYS